MDRCRKGGALVSMGTRDDRNTHLYAERLKRFLQDVTLYPVSCEKLAQGRSDREWLEGVLAGGARIVQLRDKESPDRVLLEKARYFREKTRRAGALFMVNDRLDIALLSDADGVHVGQKDLPPEEIRHVAPDMIIGVSCNTADQARALGEMEKRKRGVVSYFNIGPLFPTSTKEGMSTFLGLEAIREFSSFCSLPFTVMGGIKLEHVAQLVAAGARRIAVVTAITGAPDFRKETERWISTIRQVAMEDGDERPW